MIKMSKEEIRECNGGALLTGTVLLGAKIVKSAAVAKSCSAVVKTGKLGGGSAVIGMGKKAGEDIYNWAKDKFKN